LSQNIGSLDQPMTSSKKTHNLPHPDVINQNPQAQT